MLSLRIPSYCKSTLHMCMSIFYHKNNYFTKFITFNSISYLIANLFFSIKAACSFVYKESITPLSLDLLLSPRPRHSKPPATVCGSCFARALRLSAGPTVDGRGTAGRSSHVLAMTSCLCIGNAQF